MKTIVISGAAQGIGLAATKVFLNGGWNVMMADYNDQAGQKQADQLGQHYQIKLPL